MSAPLLSICVPMYREAPIVAAFVAEVRAAADAVDAPWELVIADDASGDATLPALQREAAADARVRVVALPSNRGQLGATQAAMAASRGSYVVTLDGDMQDPPSAIPGLWATWRRLDVAPESLIDAVFACKAVRAEAWWVQAGSHLLHAAMRTIGAVDLPVGAGSYVLMRGALARAIAALPAGRANLVVLVAARARRWGAHPYAKRARHDDRSRIGFFGLVREALACWVLTRVVERGCSAAAVTLGLAASVAGPLRPLLAVTALVAGAAAAAAWHRRRRVLG